MLLNAQTHRQATRSAAPFILRHAPRHPRARVCAERAWSLYPPIALLLAALLLATGCRQDSSEASSASAAPSPDAQFISDADRPSHTVEAILFPAYPSEIPLAGTADARATIRYGKNRIELANLSESPWAGARVWVNERYSVLLPYTKPRDIRSIHFDFLRDENGRRFPTDNSSIRIEKIELITGDERADVRFGLGY